MKKKLGIMTMALLMVTGLLVGIVAAAGNVLQITAPANVYAHVYRPFPVQTGDEVWVQASTKVGPQSGSSWTTSLFLYWGPEAFIGLGLEGSGQFRMNAQGFQTIGKINVGIEARQWVDLRIGLTDTILSLAAREQGGDWVILQETLRPPVPATLPAEILLGKGFGNNQPAYPHPHCDNSYGEAGAVGSTYVDDLIVTVDGKTVLHDTFDSLSGWAKHQDPMIGESAFAIVSGQVAADAYKE